jgi:hypothetical protein
MASNRQQFKRAVNKWEALANDGYYSVPLEIGRTAIISSPFTDEEPGTVAGIAELAAFRREAIDLADQVRLSGGEPEVAIDATRHDITRLIQDPNIVSIYAIGNGSLSALLLDVNERYDWSDLSKATNHVKRGIFVQRQCGGLTRSLNVPLGLFAVDDPRNVFAAVAVEFYPQSLEDTENEKIMPVFNFRSLSYQIIKQLSSEGQPESTDADFTDLQLLARSQPVIDVNAVGPSLDTSISVRHTQYGGNFFKRFIEIKAIVLGEAKESEITYIRMIKERFGLDLLCFYNDNYDLCEAICDSIHAKEPYDKLMNALKRIETLEASNELPEGSVRTLNEATGHPLGIEAIGMFYWSHINPLLEDAYSLIEQSSLNAPFLTR